MKILRTGEHEFRVRGDGSNSGTTIGKPIGLHMRYRSDLMTVKNRLTNNVTYYLSKCDVFTRISKEEYWKRYNAADGLENMYTKTSKHFVRQYRTAIYENLPNW